MFTSDIIVDYLLTFLCLDDLPHFQAVDKGARCVLDNSGVWHCAVSQAFPALDLPAELLQSPTRIEVLALCSAVAKVTWAEDAAVPLKSVSEVRSLAKAVQAARLAAARHVAEGGAAACVAVGRLRFAPGALRAAFLKPPRQRQGAAREGEEPPPPLLAGAPLRLRVPGALARALGSGPALQLGFAWEYGALVASARGDRGGGPGQESPGAAPGAAAAPGARLAVEVGCKAEAVVVHQRGSAAVGGAWGPAARGVCLFPQGRRAAAAALSGGVLCALCLKAGGGGGSRPEAESLARVLNLDV